MESGLNFINLHFDILDIIFSKLKFVDQINLGCAHPNLREVFLYHNRCELNSIDLDDFPVAMWDSLLSLCGPLVKWLSSDFLNSNLLLMNCAVKHCKSLQSIHFSIVCGDNLDEIKRKFCELKTLNYVSINSSADDQEEFFKIMESMQELPNLRQLILCNFSEDALVYLRTLTQLEELVIFNIYEHDIGYICGTLKNLRVLQFTGTIKDADSFQALPQFCPLLEKLMLTIESPIQIPYFPKLKELKLEFNDIPIDQILGDCGHRYAKQLDKLTMYTSAPNESSELLEKLGGIKRFKISNDFA